ncbi:MAG: MerR family transcriptional regulator [Chloroflexota bacterium]
MFRIGEFSKIAQVTIKQLRYYDEIELFQPEHIDRFTSYRYYVAKQLPDLHRIIAMKDLGLSLEQIKRFVVDEIASDELRGMLALKRSQVEQELHEKMMQLQKIDARLNQVDHGDHFDEEAIILKEIPAVPFYGFRQTLGHLMQVRNYLFEMNKTLPKNISKKKLGHLTVIQHEDGFETENADIEMGVMLHDAIDGVLQLGSGPELTMGLLPRIETAACIVRVGGTHKTVGCYDTLGRWAEANGFNLTGAPREVFINPPQPDNFKDAVTEIQVPVTPKES